MQINVHSGLQGQITPYVTIQHDQDLGNCRVTRYTFREYDGGELTVVHFEHEPLSDVADDAAVIAWEDLPAHEIQSRKLP